MFGKQQFVGKVEGSITEKYELIKVNNKNKSPFILFIQKREEFYY